jgi:hypothetical protein
MSDSTEPTQDDKAKELEMRMNRARGLHPKRRLYVAETPAGTLILGTPKRGEYHAYLALRQSDNAADKAKANDQLLVACAIDPAPAEYVAPDGILDQFPGLPQGELYITLQKAAGTIKEDFEKK